MNRVYSFVFACLIILWYVTITLKICNLTSLPWFWVLCPLWAIPVGIVTIVAAIVAFVLPYVLIKKAIG